MCKAKGYRYFILAEKILTDLHKISPLVNTYGKLWVANGIKRNKKIKKTGNFK